MPVQLGASLDRTGNRLEFLLPIHLLVIFTYFYQHQFYCILKVLTLLNSSLEGFVAVFGSMVGCGAVSSVLLFKEY